MIAFGLGGLLCLVLWYLEDEGLTDRSYASARPVLPRRPTAGWWDGWLDPWLADPGRRRT